MQIETSYEKVKNFIEVESNSGCELLSEEYINNSTKMALKCGCGNIFQTSFSKFKDRNKRQCNKCSNINRANKLRKTKGEFEREIYNLVRDEYTIVKDEEYKNTSTKIKIRHNVCEHEWSVTPANFLRGTRCPRCSRPNYNRDTIQFKEEALLLTNGDYKVLGKYKSARDKILIKHNIIDCEHEWEVTPDNFLQGSRCPQCNESKGEEKIRIFLDNKKINYKPQYTFDDLMGVGGGLLKFDFAVFDLNNNITFLIEYDGEFHFEKQYSDDKFETIQIHDERKNQYCKNNNIHMLRIPYWSFDNIENIIQNQLNSYEEVLCETN